MPGHRSSDHQTVTAIALEAQRQARKATVDLAILGGIDDERLVAQILHGLEHGRIALGDDDRTVDPDAVGAVSLVLGHDDLVVLGKVGFIDKLTGDEHVVVLDVVDARLEVQDLLQRNLGTLEAPALENLAELADALFVGASGATDVEMVADHHDVAAVERASSSKKRRTAGSISSFSPLRLSAPGLVMMAPQRVITAGSSTKQLSGYCSSAGSTETSTPHCSSACS